MKNQRAAKSGADKTHGITRRKHAGLVAAWGKSAGQISQYYVRRSPRDIQNILNGTKASLRKTHRTQTEANDKVRDMNRKTEQALDTFAILNARFEQVTKDLAEVDEQFHKEFDELRWTPWMANNRPEDWWILLRRRSMQAVTIGYPGILKSLKMT